MLLEKIKHRHFLWVLEWSTCACARVCNAVWTATTSPKPSYQLTVENPSLRQEDLGTATYAHSTSTCFIIKSCQFPLQHWKQFHLKKLRARICLTNVYICIPNLIVLGRLLAPKDFPMFPQVTPVRAWKHNVVSTRHSTEKGKRKCCKAARASGWALGWARRKEALPVPPHFCNQPCWAQVWIATMCRATD